MSLLKLTDVGIALRRACVPALEHINLTVEKETGSPSWGRPVQENHADEYQYRLWADKHTGGSYP